MVTTTICTAKPTRLSMLTRYLFPPLTFLLTNIRTPGLHGWLAPLVVYGFYSLLRFELGWSERFFTLTLYAYASLLYLTHTSTLTDSIFLSSLLVTPLMLAAIEAERAFCEYCISEENLEVRGLRQDSFLPRMIRQKMPLHLVKSVKTHYPLLSRILGRRYADIVIETDLGSIVLRGVPATSELPAFIERKLTKPTTRSIKQGSSARLKALQTTASASTGDKKAESGEENRQPPKRRMRNRIDRLLWE